MGLNSQKYRRATNLSLGGFGAQNTAGHSEVKLSHDGTRPKKPSFVSKDTETKGQLDNCQTSNFGHLLNYQLDSIVTPVVKCKMSTAGSSKERYERCQSSINFVSSKIIRNL